MGIMQLSISQLIPLILFWLVCGLLSYRLAKRRGRQPIVWFLIGFFMSIFGVIALLLLPRARRRVEVPTQPLRAVFPKRSESWLKMWYLLDQAHTQDGPYEFPDLIKKWKESGINEKSYVWGEGMKEWKRFSELPELVREIEQA